MATIRVKAGIDSTQYRRGVDEMEKKNKKFSNGLGKIKGKLKAAFAVAGIASVVAGLKSLTSAAIQTASSLSRMADQSSASVDTLNKLGFAARNAGEDLETVRDALGAVRTAQGEVLAGDEGMRKEFEKLGITLEEIGTLNVPELFARMGRALEETGNDAVRFSAVAKIIGEGDALKLQETFQAAAGGIGEMRTELGALTEQQAASIEVARRWGNEWKQYIVNFWAGVAGKIVDRDGEAQQIIEQRRQRAKKEEDRRKQSLAKLKADIARTRKEEREKEERKVKEQILKIEKSVKLDIQTDEFRAIGGRLGGSISPELQTARRQLIIMEKTNEILMRVENNTKDSGSGLA